jgi:hypothetical protein
MSSGEQVELQLTYSSVPAAGISVRPTWQVPFPLGTIRSQKQNTNTSSNLVFCLQPQPQTADQQHCSPSALLPHWEVLNATWSRLCTRQATYEKQTIEASSRNYRCNGRAVNVTHSVRVFVASVIQHVKHMRPIVLSSVTWLDVPYCSHRLINCTIFGEKF